MFVWQPPLPKRSTTHLPLVKTILHVNLTLVVSQSSLEHVILDHKRAAVHSHLITLLEFT